MNGINVMNSLAFRGMCSSESAGSIANRKDVHSSNGSASSESAGSVANRYNMLSFRGTGSSESAGSIANRENIISFQGPGSTESAGSIGYGNKMADSKPIKFNGYDDYYKEEKKTSYVGILAGIAAFTALAIGGLGYAHKSGVFNKENFLGKLKPVGEKCHDWCKVVKTKSVELWNKVKDSFSGKG